MSARRIPPNILCNGLPNSFLGLAPQAGNYPIFEGTSLYSLRLDHNLTNSNRLMLRANVSPSTVTGIQVNGENQTYGQNAYSRTSQQTYHDVAGVVQDTRTIGNNKVNEFRFQYARRGLSYFYSNAPGGSCGVQHSGLWFRRPRALLLHSAHWSSATSSPTISPSRIGRHDMKFGVDFNYIPMKPHSP